MFKFQEDDTFTTQLPADPETGTQRRQVTEAFYSFVSPRETSKPRLLHVSPEMLNELGIAEEDAASQQFLDVLTGNAIAKNSRPYSMVYAGHQFGNWAGQLGDGRAINLGEIKHNGKSWVIQLKGAGETPFSRSADGLAVLRSSIREYLCSEAMHHLGVPTTRALSLAITGDEVLRDMLYDGNPALEKGAITSRVSPSFLRFGNFELFAARKDYGNLKKLTDYTIVNLFPHLGEPNRENYIQFFKEVADKTLEMIVHWQRVGFVHGVMNTDNMSILGLTIDYGPYGWLEGFDFGWTPNTTDRQNKRYRYGNQPNIGLWNLYQLANALFPLIESVEPLQEILDGYAMDFKSKSLAMMRSKLGLQTVQDSDGTLIEKLEDNLRLVETDMTIFFRNLSRFRKANLEDGFALISQAFYVEESLTKDVVYAWQDWFKDYAQRLEKETIAEDSRERDMNSVNPKYVLRNYMAQLAIDEADNGNYKLIEELFNLLKQPYAEQPKNDKWFAKRPEWARHKVGCSMLSCSS